MRAPADLLCGYYHAVHKLTLEYITTVTADELARIVDTNWNPPVTASARLVSIIDDCAQHLGQAAYLRGISRVGGVRFAVTLVLWLLTTVALAAAVPGAWAQVNIVNEGGYAALAQQAAGDPALQSAAAGELVSTRALALVAARSEKRHPVDSAQVHDAAAAFTAGPSFPPLFAQANRAAHRWLFNSAGSSDSWVVDLAPMLNDSSIRENLGELDNVKVPATLTVPVTVSTPSVSLRQGELSRLAAWGPWASIGAVALSGVCGLLTLAAARRRGKALTSLGVSALLVGGAGWAGIELGGRYINAALNGTTGDVRQIAEVMVGHAEFSLHQWLDDALIGGGALVGSGRWP